MTGPYVVVIADDLTGAADSGVAFASLGLRTLVVWCSEAMPEAEVLVLTTESRHREQAEAVRRVQSGVKAVVAVPGVRDGAWLYKKIDSTLRGHPGPELKAVMAEFGLSRALVAPAFPAQGRTTVGGLHLVDGIPLTETVFGQAVSSARVAERIADAVGVEAVHELPLKLVRQGPAAVAATIQRMPARIFIGDAEREADLETLASAALRSGIRLLCGSAGLAAALAGALPTHDPGLVAWRSPETAHPPKPREGHVLVIAASRHPQTARQIRFLEAAGIAVVRPEAGWFTDDASPGGDIERWVEQLRQGPLVLTSQGLPDLPGAGERIVARLAGAARTLCQRVPVAGLILTGGDAAIAAGRALEAEAMWLRGEVHRGMPWSTFVGGIAPALTVITKAGGFGGEDGLLAAIEALS
ncbi:MAG: four-carbon acid sugar kinase family protein [Anaerolineae bacterium]